MPRQILEDALIHEQIKDRLGGSHTEIIEEVQTAAANAHILIVGMAQNPFCKKVRKQLDAAKLAYEYLEFGSYFSAWQPRLALKMWTGWPTFPMVFVAGQLVGGNEEVSSLLASGALSAGASNEQ